MSIDFKRHSSSILRQATVCASSILYLSLAALTASAGLGEAKSQTLRQRLESAKVLQEFNIEGAEVHQFKVAKNLVAFLLWKMDSSVVVAYGLDGTRRFRFGLQDAGFRRLLGFNVSEDGSTLVVTEVLGFESLNMRVFDITGALRFSVHSEIDIITSPAGKYFCSRDVTNSSEILTIYDSVGHQIQPVGDMPGWNCRFVTDEILIVADPDTLRFVDVPRGLVTRSIPLEFRGRWDSPPGICVSPSHSLVAVYNPGGDSSAVQLFSASGGLKWRTSYPDQLCTVAFDDGEQWLALQFGNPRAPAGFVKIVSVLDPAVAYQSAEVAALGNAVFGGYVDHSRFCGNLITIAGPAHAGPDIKPDAPVVTVFLEFNEVSRVVEPSVTLAGLWRALPNLGNARRLIVVRPDMPATLISTVQGGRAKP